MKEYECYACGGRGYHYLGDPDPVEGYKMVDKRKCDACKGEKKAAKGTPLGDAFAAYHAANDKIIAENNRIIKERKEKRKAALDKLTLEDMEILGLVK